MNLKLFEILTQRGIITEGTSITATGYRQAGASGLLRRLPEGTFLYRKHTPGKSDFKIVAFDPASSGNVHVLASEITLVDGMPLQRLSCLYGLSVDGEPIAMAPRRGRRPKNRE